MHAAVRHFRWWAVRAFGLPSGEPVCTPAFLVAACCLFGSFFRWMDEVWLLWARLFLCPSQTSKVHQFDKLTLERQVDMLLSASKMWSRQLDAAMLFEVIFYLWWICDPHMSCFVCTILQTNRRSIILTITYGCWGAYWSNIFSYRFSPLLKLTNLWIVRVTCPEIWLWYLCPAKLIKLHALFSIFSPLWIVNVFLQCDWWEIWLWCLCPAQLISSLSPPTPRQQFDDVIGDKGFFQIFTAFKISGDVGHDAGCSVIEQWSLILPKQERFNSLRKILSNSNMKRLFNPRKRSEGEPVGEQANTLDRIVKDKEGIRRRLEEEEKEFLGKKREAERKMIEFEKQVAIPFKYLCIESSCQKICWFGIKFVYNQLHIRFASNPLHWWFSAVIGPIF